MRFVPTSCIREGMVTGRQLIGKNGVLLLNKGAVIQSTYVKKIQELGYNGIYIMDEVSDDVEFSDLISDSLKQKTVFALKSVFIGIEREGILADSAVESIDELADEIVESILSSKEIMINMIDLKVFDDYTFYHSVNVAVLSIVLGAASGFTKQQLKNLAMSAILHDIGKVFIPKEILTKPGKLTPSEFEVIKSHTSKGYEYLKDKFSVSPSAYIGILQHHENFDGTGYPMNLKGHGISQFGRILAIVDVYDALTSDRPYRKALSPSEAVEYLMGAGGYKFDPELISCFIHRIAPYPVGSCVNLSDGRTAVVIKNYSDCCIRPKLKIIKQGEEYVTSYYIDLRNDIDEIDTTIIGFSDIL